MLAVWHSVFPRRKKSNMSAEVRVTCHEIQISLYILRNQGRQIQTSTSIAQTFWFNSKLTNLLTSNHDPQDLQTLYTQFILSGWYRFIIPFVRVISFPGEVFHVILTRVEFKINLISGANSPGQYARSTPAFSSSHSVNSLRCYVSVWNQVPFYSSD